MSEYISKESIVTLLEQYGYIDKEMERDLASIPSADVRPNIHGHWIDKINDYFGYVTHCECSECGYTVRKAYAVEYIGCPYCLADMREPKGEKGET